VDDLAAEYLGHFLLGVSDYDLTLDAIETLESAGHNIDLLFGERPVEPHTLPSHEAWSAGLIEGAAITAGLTALELLDALQCTDATLCLRCRADATRNQS
jgi:hypothetical protein